MKYKREFEKWYNDTFKPFKVDFDFDKEPYEKGWEACEELIERKSEERYIQGFKDAMHEFHTMLVAKLPCKDCKRHKKVIKKEEMAIPKDVIVKEEE